MATNALRWGTGALNIDAGRIAFTDNVNMDAVNRQHTTGGGVIPGAFGAAGLIGKEIPLYKPGGRWPANLILQHRPACVPAWRCDPECPVAALDVQSGVLSSNSGKPFNRSGRATGAAAIVPGKVDGVSFYGDTGGASRFFLIIGGQPPQPRETP